MKKKSKIGTTRREFNTGALFAVAAPAVLGGVGNILWTTPSPAATFAGSIKVMDAGSVKIHDYEAPEDGLFVHSVIVEGPTKIVLFDTQFFLAYATEVADYIEGLKKPVERIVISHIHPDHWSGLDVLGKRFPSAPIYALQNVKDYIAENGLKMMTIRQGVFGNKIAAKPTVPTHVLATGEAVIDSVTYEFEEFDEGESKYQLVARMPAQKALLAFDLVFPKHVHVFTVAPYFDHWIEILQTLAKKEFDTILVGHSHPATRDDITETIAYLKEAKIIHDGTKDPKEYAAQVKAKFPDRQEPGWIDFSGLLLYGVINP